MEKDIKKIKEELVELNTNVSKLLELLSKEYQVKHNPPRNGLVKRKGKLVQI